MWNLASTLLRMRQRGNIFIAIYIFAVGKIKYVIAPLLNKAHILSTMWNCMLASHTGYFPLCAHSVRSLVGTGVSSMYCIRLMRMSDIGNGFRRRSEQQLFMISWFIQSSSFLFMFIHDVSLCKMHSILLECVLACWHMHIAIRIQNIHSSVVIGNESKVYITHLTGMTSEVWSSNINIVIGHCTWNTSFFFFIWVL